MSKQYPGGIISKTPVIPSGPYSNDTASGIWTLDQQAYWQKLGQWPTAGNNPIDPQFNYVTMLLHGDGTNGAQNNTFLDSSTNNFTITRNGNTTQGSFSPYGSNWSNYFSGSSTYLNLGTNSAYNFSTGSWTYECWVNLSGTSTSAYYTLFSNGWPVQVYVRNNAFELYVGTSNSSSGQIVNGQTTSANSVPIGSWVHFALVRNSSNSTYKMYVNGVEQASTTSATNPIASTDNFVIGAFGPNLTSGSVIRFLGYISNFRATASAVYTGTFTPSTTPLTAISGTGLLTCQSNRFIDNSTNNFTITVTGTPSVERFNPFGASTAYSTSVIGGSGYFDGSGDYLSTANSSAFAFGTGNFTVEFWYRGTSTGGGFGITTGGSSGYWQFNLFSSTLYWSNNVGVSNVLSVSATSILNNAWNHVAIVRNSTTLTLYFNGVSVASASDSSNYSGTGGDFRLGLDGNSAYIAGYIADYRIVKGTAVYTSAFTPPTAPLTAITNTSLMTNFTNGAIFDNAMMNDLETVGNAQISTSVVKYGTGSMYFDGTGDNLNTPTSPNLAFGTGDFTIECWVYANDVTSLAGIYDGRGGSATPTIVIQSGTFKYFTNGGFQITSSSISTSTWYHLAVSRSGTNTKLFVNGVQGGSTYSDSTNYVSTTPSFIGALYDGSSLNGYIDDLRITKGYARYTANFTPPTAAFFNYGPT